MGLILILMTDFFLLVNGGHTSNMCVNNSKVMKFNENVYIIFVQNIIDNTQSRPLSTFFFLFRVRFFFFYSIQSCSVDQFDKSQFKLQIKTYE